MHHLLDQELGNYRLLRLLGQGGFAEVYLGEHLHLGTQAAIKVHYARMEGADLARFEQEARVIANLAHSQIVRVLEYGVQDGVAFLVMEYAPGGTLRDRHPAGTQVALAQVVEYVRQIAAALHYAHEQRLIHRDVKPENMLIDARGQLLLSDFGQAPAHDTRSLKTQDAIGTVSYMAPEQLQKKARPASDQYALATLAYEWLCGSPPFEGLPIEVALQHLTEPVPSIREKYPDLPLAVEKVLLRALSKEPEQRFPTMLAFARALDEASRSDGFAQPPARTNGSVRDGWRDLDHPREERKRDPRPASWWTRTRVAICAGLIALFVLASGMMGAFVVRQQANLLPTRGSTVGTEVTGRSVAGGTGVLPGDWDEPDFDAENSSNNRLYHSRRDVEDVF